MKKNHIKKMIIVTFSFACFFLVFGLLNNNAKDTRVEGKDLKDSQQEKYTLEYYQDEIEEEDIPNGGIEGEDSENPNTESDTLTTQPYNY